MRRILSLLLVSALMLASLSACAEQGPWNMLNEIMESFSLKERAAALIEDALASSAEAASRIGNTLFTDTPFTESLAWLGEDAGKRFSAFLSGFFETEICTGRELQAALQAWLEEQGILIGRLAEEVAAPMIGASAFCLLMICFGGLLTLGGEMSADEYAQLRSILADAMRATVADFSERARNITKPDAF